MPPSCALVTIQDPVEDEDEESSDVMRDEQRMKAVKDSNKQKERDAVLRGTDITLRVASHNTVDVKNNVEDKVKDVEDKDKDKVKVKVKDSNKQKERDAVLRGTDITLRVASHNTVDVKNNVEDKVKDSNKQKERDAVLRGTDIALRVASHNTVDVKNNVEKGQHSLTDVSSLWFVYELVVPGLNDLAFPGEGRSDKRATIREVPGHVPR